MRKLRVTENLVGLTPGETLNLHVRTVSCWLVEKFVEWSPDSDIRHASICIDNYREVKLPSTPLS
jgi:hypothetical protein